MKNFPLVAIAFALVGVPLGSGGAYAVMNRDEASTTSDFMSGMDHGSMQMSSTDMDSVNAQLKGKTGDDFDRTFLFLMTKHHQGAIDMATQAKQNAKHPQH